MKFSPGVSGNPSGRPRGSKGNIAKLRNSAVAKYSVEDIQEVLDVLLSEAKEGDFSAAKMFLEYLLPKADKCLDIQAVEDNMPDVSNLSTQQLVEIVNIANRKPKVNNSGTDK